MTLLCHLPICTTPHLLANKQTRSRLSQSNRTLTLRSQRTRLHKPRPTPAPGIHITMDPFFSSFPSFPYARTSHPEHEFHRLAAHCKWKRSSELYKTHRREFLTLLATVARSRVHEFFTITYPFADYNPLAHPKHEFARLAAARKWSPAGSTFQEAEELFHRQYQFEFGSSVLDFFEDYEQEGVFEYNPRGKMEVELYRMADCFEWQTRERRGQGIPVSPEWVDAKEKFWQAIGEDFNMTFGYDDEEIIGWQFLFQVLGVGGEKPTTAEECRKVSSPPPLPAPQV